MAAVWSQLQPELIGLIFMRLSDLNDRIQFRHVCRSWRYAMTEGLHRSRSFPPPLLMMSSQEQGPNGCKNCNLYGLRNDENFQQLSNVCQLEKHATYLASMGWLFVYVPKNGHLPKPHLLNPILRRRIDIPVKWKKSAQCGRFLDIKNVVLSSPATSDDCVMVSAASAFTMLDIELGWCRPRQDEEWTVFYSEKRMHTSDYTYRNKMRFCEGQFFLLGNTGVVSVFGFDPESGFRRTMKVMPPLQPEPYATSVGHSLVESDEGILLVLNDGHISHGLYLKIFKLEAGDWVRIQRLGDRAVLLTETTAESVPSKGLFGSAFRSNCVYCFSHRRRLGVYVFSMEDGCSIKLPLPSQGANREGAWIKPRIW